MMLNAEQAYKMIRHMKADMIRDIRAALDVGVPVKQIKAESKGEYRDIFGAAVDHMVANPELGVARWTDGDRYEFVSERK